MDCRECQKLLDNMLVAEPTAAESAAMAVHLKECSGCPAQSAQAHRALAAITPADPLPVSPDFKQRVLHAILGADASALASHDEPAANGRPTTQGQRREAPRAAVEGVEEERLGFEALARSLGRVECVASEGVDKRPGPTRVGTIGSNNYFFGRMKNMILSHKRLSAAAAATATTLTVCLILYVLSSCGSAYALEQTVHANSHVTTCHVKITPAGEDDVNEVWPQEVWLQLDQNGTPLRIRSECPDTPNGPRIVLISDGKGKLWYKERKMCITLDDKDTTDDLKQFEADRAWFDPKIAFEELQKDKEAGKVQVATKEPAKEGQPIVLTVTSNDKPDRRLEYRIDPQTKLVERVIEFHRRGDQWEQVSVREYLDYNKPIDPKVFELDLPNDVITGDQNTMNIGLAKGNLSDDEIAVKVAREFYEAKIAGDYDKASQITGMPAEYLKRGGRATFKVVRIVEVGKPAPIPGHAGPTRQVPIKVECQSAEGKVIESPVLGVQSTDAEKAAKAVRQHYEALIARDYDKAGRILKEEMGWDEDGMKQFEELKQRLQSNDVKFLRIVEIGTPELKQDASFRVRLKIEVEIKAGTKVRSFSPWVAPVNREQPDRWMMVGNY